MNQMNSRIFNRRLHLLGAACLTLLLGGGPVLAGLPAGYGELDRHVRAAMEAIDAATHKGGEALSAPLDALQVWQMAADRNPEVIGALDRVRQGLIATRKELGLPDLGVSLEARDFTRVPAFDSMQGNMLAVSRMWPLGDKLSRKALAAFHGAGQALHEYEAIVADLLRDARIAVSEVYSADRQIAILDENIVLSRQLAEVAKAKYMTALARQPDVLKADVEATRYENERIAMVRMAGVARAMVNSILSRPSSAPVPRTAAPARVATMSDIEPLEARARERRPEVLAAASGIEKARAEVSLATAERNRPDLEGQVGYMQNPEGDRDGWVAMVRLNLPWFSGRRKLEVDEASAGLAAERARFESVWNKTRFAIREAVLRFREAIDSLALFEEKLLPQARQTFESTRAAYETDQLDFLSLVDSQRSLKDVAMGQVKALAEVARRAAELDRATGSLPGSGQQKSTSAHRPAPAR